MVDKVVQLFSLIQCDCIQGHDYSDNSERRPEYLPNRGQTTTRVIINYFACHNAVRSLILSRIDYCNGLLSTIPSTRLQNWAARLNSPSLPCQFVIKSNKRL